MRNYTNELLGAPCGVPDEYMKTTYAIDFGRRGWPGDSYRKLMPQVDCQDCQIPVQKQILGLKNGYRDICSFRLTPHDWPSIDSSKPVTFSITPETVNFYLRSYPGRSDYQDTYNRQGKAICNSSQQFREPLPSSRRRSGDSNI